MYWTSNWRRSSYCASYLLNKAVSHDEESSPLTIFPFIILIQIHIGMHQVQAFQAQFQALGLELAELEFGKLELRESLDWPSRAWRKAWAWKAWSRQAWFKKAWAWKKLGSKKLGLGKSLSSAWKAWESRLKMSTLSDHVKFSELCMSFLHNQYWDERRFNGRDGSFAYCVYGGKVSLIQLCHLHCW